VVAFAPAREPVAADISLERQTFEFPADCLAGLRCAPRPEIVPALFAARFQDAGVGLTKLEVAAVRDLGLWKKWIVGTEAIFLSEVSDPVDSDVMEIVADREENGGEGFRVLRPDLA
jgi:hypothetical protein